MSMPDVQSRSFWRSPAGIAAVLAAVAASTATIMTTMTPRNATRAAELMPTAGAFAAP